MPCVLGPGKPGIMSQLRLLLSQNYLDKKRKHFLGTVVIFRAVVSLWEYHSQLQARLKENFTPKGIF